MARVTKRKKKLTIEEKLSEALVPESEQPYKVPENWCWVRIGAVSIIYTGNSINERIKKEKYYEQPAGLLYIATKDIAFDGTVDYETKVRINDFEKFKVAPANTALLCIEGGSAGRKIGFVNQDVCFVNKLCAFVANTVNSKFIYYYLLSQGFLDQFNARKHGLIGGVSVNELSTISFTLPPLPEQQRIVTRIESLFSKLNEAKEKAQAVVDGFEDRKAAILHKAFTGELTAEWRSENSVAFSDWKINVLEACFDIVSGIQKKPSRAPKNNPVPYITVANVYRNRIDLSDLRYFEVLEGELEKLQLKYADILIVEGNGSGNEIGRCAMWRDELPVCIHQNHIIRIRRKDDSVLPEYVLFYLNSSSGKHIMKERAKTTAGLYNLSTGKIKTIPVPFAPIKEQQEIVCILNKMLEMEQQAKEVTEQVISQIDIMKKSILSRALRGELGTNDPADESAVELLKTIL